MNDGKHESDGKGSWIALHGGMMQRADCKNVGYFHGKLFVVLFNRTFCANQGILGCFFLPFRISTDDSSILVLLCQQFSSERCYFHSVQCISFKCFRGNTWKPIKLKVMFNLWGSLEATLSDFLSTGWYLCLVATTGISRSFNQTLQLLLWLELQICTHTSKTLRKLP